MLLNKWVFAAVCWTWASLASAAPYIVLFKAETSAPDANAKVIHKKVMEDRQQANDRNIGALFQALGVPKDSVPYTNLWLISGLAIDLKDQDIENVKKIELVAKVLPDQSRVYIKPDFSVRGLPAQDWGLQRLSIPELRTQFPEALGKGVRVGIIDTGIQSRHPEFDQKNLVVFHDFVNHLASPYDDQGHGTHVAGTIAGATTGVAPLVDIYMAKAFSASGSAYDSWLLEAMQWMFDPDGDANTDDFPLLVNNSWGLDLPFDINDLDAFEPLHRAIQAWSEAHIIPVFAAGNTGAAPNGMPGGFPEALAIAAIDDHSGVAEFSSRGPNYWKAGDQVLTLFKPDFAAPGVDIYSAWPGNGYEYLSGTSMATPHASGSIALILQQTGRLSTGQLKTLLLYSMETKFDFNYGSGIINPLAALKMLQAPADHPAPKLGLPH